ncbi:hypothetical protein ASPCAL14620 [Aspergillus calidoustus]|uniref:Uncharacterized protein n=1 Tax=Aspergillus calidoustus TaxID=454130 RepID=A0A0U5GL05_ASPCI|nr:hypothetical protein ASPCAL14620 [Aspergillus calidoustus]
MPVNVALIGGGIWAQEEHLPAVEAAEDLELKAIFSRSLASATSAAALLPRPVDVYSDESGDGYSEILARSDIDAVVISLPIANQGKYIRAALLAGKHVLSEKPVAENVAEAEELIRWYRTEIKGATWAVAENFRFLDSYAYAADQIKTLGRIIGFQGRQQGFVEVDWKFNLTSWRRSPTHQGGYILDGGVHYIASLRTLLGAHPGNEIARVSAFTSQLQPYLPPVDTADVILRTKSGVTGTFQISRGTSLRADEWTVACERGWVTVRGEEVSVSRGGEVEVQRVPNERTGVPPEIRAWGKAVLEGRVVPEQEPEAALADLEVIELILKSGENDGIPINAKHQVV